MLRARLYHNDPVGSTSERRRWGGAWWWVELRFQGDGQVGVERLIYAQISPYVAPYRQSVLDGAIFQHKSSPSSHGKGLQFRVLKTTSTCFRLISPLLMAHSGTGASRFEAHFEPKGRFKALAVSSGLTLGVRWVYFPRGEVQAPFKKSWNLFTKAKPRDCSLRKIRMFCVWSIRTPPPLSMA